MRNPSGGLVETKPVAVGDELQVTIESEGGRGDGIAKKDNFVIFVTGGKNRETCKVKITAVKRTFATAEKV